jgi:drug/metabolite transporter (DMT)-like permease
MSESIKGITALIAYTFMGPTIILINQFIMKSLLFPYPIFLSALGVLAAGLIAKALVIMQVEKEPKSEGIEGWLWYTRVLPVGLSFAATLSLGNMVYLYLDIGFIQMLKSFAPVLILVVGYLSGVEKVTIPLVVSVLLVTIGTVVTCFYSAKFNVWGFIIMLGSLSAEAVRLVLTQFFLKNLKFGVIQTQYLLSPASALWLFAASLVFEIPQMMVKKDILILINNPTPVLVMILTGVGMNFVSNMVIQFTSSLTMKILTTMRNILLVFVGVSFYREVVTDIQMIGYLISLTGFVGYNLAQMGCFDNVDSKLSNQKKYISLSTSEKIVNKEVELGLVSTCPSSDREDDRDLS